MTVSLTPLCEVLYQEGIGQDALGNLIKSGLFPEPIVVLIGKRRTTKYFPTDEIEARRACLVAYDGDEDKLRELLASLKSARGERAHKELDLILKSLGGE